MSERKIVVIYGPTGVGKTECALELANKIKGEIINADVGQFYRPLSIGTAKPLWQEGHIKQHFFDILDKPQDFTVSEYRKRLLPLLDTIWQRGNMPIITGGSGFYISSLFFPPQEPLARSPHDSESILNILEEKKKQLDKHDTKTLWLLLKDIDPVRAQKIDIHDRYRIERALEIWYTTGVKPSWYRPVYSPVASYCLLYLTRDRHDLYARINKRVNSMINQGWIDEVRQLRSTQWEKFLEDKKIIGYHDILNYLKGSQTDYDYRMLIEIIAQKTRNYAKRQLTFWRMLKKRLEPYTAESESMLLTINLTITDSQVYIKQLLTKNQFFKNKATSYE